MNLANEMAAEFVRQADKSFFEVDMAHGEATRVRIKEAKVYDLLVRFRDRLQAAGQVVREDQ